MTDTHQTINNIGRLLSLGEIGCAMSHQFIYAKIIEENISQAIILEDDIDFLTNNITEVFNYLKKNNESSRPRITLLTKPISYLSKNMKKINDQYNQAEVVQALSTAGYVINQLAAKKLIDCNRNISTYADNWSHFKRECKVSINCIMPWVVENNLKFSRNSTIMPEKALIKKKRTFKYVVFRNKNKLFADFLKYVWLIPFKGYKRLR